MSSIRLVCVCGLVAVLFSCGKQPESIGGMGSATEQGPQTDQEVVAHPSIFIDSNSLFSDYFSDEIGHIAHQIKEEFEAGIRLPSEADSSLAYLYRQHARKLRIQFMDQDPMLPLFPFNGKLLLSDRKELADQLPFMSYLCGFQTEDGEPVHYYCPSLHEAYFEYLEVVGRSAPVLAQFVHDYQGNKTITTSIRQLMLMSSIEDLDFSDYDHQLFYCFFQLWVADEMQAYLKVRES